jgi:hypothetical protein
MATAANTTEITFQTGPYGELFPLPLLAGMTQEEALEQLVEDSAAAGYPFDPPTRGQYVDEMGFRGQVHVHQQRLPRALAGEMDVPEAQALRIAVLEQGHPMSLRPFGMEILDYGSFAPVLQYLGEGRWQIGLEDEGRVHTFEETDVAQAIETAQRIFKQWADEDDEGWMEAADSAMDRFPRSLFHHYWAAQIRRDRVWNRGDGVVLHLQDNHGRFRLDLPGGAVRLYKTTTVRGVHIADAVARANDIEPDYPSSPVVMEWLIEEGLAFPEMHDEHRWDVGDVKVRLLPERQEFVLEDDGGARYAIRVEGQKPAELVLRRIVDGEPDTSMLAHTVIERPLKGWMQDAGRMVLTMWFIYDARLGGMAEKEVS